MATSDCLPFALPGFRIARVETYQDLLVIRACSIARTAKCPRCGKLSTQVHCHYTRSPRDLPCNGRRVHLVLNVRRFRCSNDGCARQTFVERLPHLVPVHGQRTTQLTRALRAMTFEVNAEAGARITRHLNMPVSADTLLRIIRHTVMEPAPTPRVLGVDDWAFKKGSRYGTILVDLERRYPVDLLPDRTTETLATWLEAHPGIEIVSRDRSNEYIAAIKTSAPQAVQVADRWHLLRNLSDALIRLLEKHAKALRQAAKIVQGDTVSDEQPEFTTEIAQPVTVRQLRFSEVKRLAAEGYSQRAIARHLHISRNTIRRYLASDEPPRYQLRAPRASAITAYIPYLETRWEEGCHNSRVLWQELRRQGYSGSYSSIRRFVQRYRTGRPHASSLLPAVVWPLSPRQAAWLLVRQPEQLLAEQEAYRIALCDVCPEIAAAYELAQRFMLMVGHRQVDKLDPWLADAKSSTVSQLKRFSTGLHNDYDAVRAAIELEWSSGQVEGQVNRLKVIKRDMYGRAKFDLLRLRVLQPP